MPERRPHVSCQEIVQLITDYLEGALDPEEASVVEQHLNFCEGCVRYVQQMRATVQAVGRVRSPDLSAETCGQLLAVFRDWKRS